MNGNKFDRDHWVWSDAHFSACLLDGLTRDGAYDVSGHEDAVAKKHRIDDGHVGFDLLEAGATRGPCVVDECNESTETCAVLYFVGDDDDDDDRGGEGGRDRRRRLRFVRDLPASHLSFVSLPRASDQHRDDGRRFVHEIEIPNFPHVWKESRQGPRPPGGP
mmetsp:Transcript_49191/g.96174  ORF Transcript_49191/g.96174 Transcript_49191/m.96174 type:complete len:162 (+) Transcript_49191:2424-2909(+)